MGTAVLERVERSISTTKIVRTGSMKILDGRHPQPVTFDRDNAEEVSKMTATVKAYEAQGFAVAIEGVIQPKGAALPVDLAEDITILAPLVGG